MRLRTFLAQRGIEAVIPSIARRKPNDPLRSRSDRQRNLIERMFARLKDFAASPPDTTSSARNFLAEHPLAAAITWWLNSVRTRVERSNLPLLEKQSPESSARCCRLGRWWMPPGRWRYSRSPGR